MGVEGNGNGVTVIIPTVGRETLRATLASLAPQLQHQDSAVIIAENFNVRDQERVSHFQELSPAQWRYMYREGGHWGHPNRNHVLDNHVHTTHVWTIDDDDIAAPTALRSLREHYEDPWTIFRMTFGPNHYAHGITCWREQKVQAGDVGTPMMFAPLSEARFGHEYMGDHTYAHQLQQQYGDPVWSEDIVAVIRP